MPTKLVGTKHHQVAQLLRKHIAQLPPGGKVPTFAELSRRFGASRTTIETALQRLRKDGLIYRPAGKQRLIVAELHDKAVSRIALLRPDYPSQDYDAICCAVVEAGKKRGWVFDLLSYGDLRALDLERAWGNNDAALLLPNCQEFPPHLIRVLSNPRKPIVLLQEHWVGRGVCNVCVDDRMVGRMAVEHLISLGHRRILMLLEQPHVSSVMERYEGWREAMIGIGETDLESLLVDCQVENGQHPLTVAYAGMSRWMEGNRTEFTAIFSTTEYGAIASIRTLDEHGLKVPDDVSVISFAGKSNLCAFIRPPLTAVEIDMESYGRATADALSELLSKSSASAQEVKIKPALWMRRTTARAPDRTARSRSVGE